jgi:hypothetical protein
MQRFKGGPRQFGACFGDGAAVDGLRVRPQAAATGLTEKGAGFTVDALVLSAGRQRQQKNAQTGECQFAFANESLRRRRVVFSGKAGRNELKKSVKKR